MSGERDASADWHTHTYGACGIQNQHPPADNPMNTISQHDAANSYDSLLNCSVPILRLIDDIRHTITKKKTKCTEQQRQN